MNRSARFILKSLLHISSMSIAIATVAPSASAGTMDLFLRIVDRWAPDFSANGLPVNMSDGRVVAGQPGNYEFEVSFTAQAAGNDKGWLSTAFSVETTVPGLQGVQGTWSPYNPNIDTNGPAPPGAITPFYHVNQDAGAPGDLTSIVISLANSSLPNDHAFDRRNEAGTPDAPPFVKNSFGESILGRFFASWDGFSDGEVQLTNHRFIFSQFPSGGGPEQVGAGASQRFGTRFDGLVVDNEFLGGALPGALITGGPLPNNADDPDTVAWTLESFTGPGGAVAGASVDPQTGVFTWQSLASSPRGLYTASIQGYGNGLQFGPDSGLLTFNLVPEPTSISLLGLAMISALGVTRRR